MYFRSSQASRVLPIPAGPITRHEPGPAVAARRVEQVLELAQLVVAADERRLERLGPVPAADLGHDPERPPGRHRARLALEDLLAGLLERDRLRGRPLGRLADEDRARLGHRLEPRGRVDEVAGDHALVRRPDRDRRFAGQDAGPGLDRRARARGPRRRARAPPGRHRSASSSWAIGAPQTAITASPMNFSTVPP